MTFSSVRAVGLSILAVLGASSNAFAQQVAFEFTGDAKRGGYIPALSSQSGNRLNIGLDPTNSLSTSVYDPSAFSSSYVSSDTIMLKIKAPAGFIIKHVRPSHTYYRFTSRGGVTANRHSVIIDGTPFVSVSDPYLVDLSSRNKSEMDVSLTSFLWGYSSLGSAVIRIQTATIDVVLAPAP